MVCFYSFINIRGNSAALTPRRLYWPLSLLLPCSLSVITVHFPPFPIFTAAQTITQESF